MKGKLTLAQIRVILILVAVMLIVLTYFLVYQTNMDKAADFDKRTADTNERVAYLESLQPKVTDLEVFTSLYVDDIEDFIQSFPVKITQQKSVYLIYRLMINTGIDIESITPGNRCRSIIKDRSPMEMQFRKRRKRRPYQRSRLLIWTR